MSLLRIDAPPAFTGGVSQQDAVQRRPTQCEVQDNWFSDSVDGMIPRHPTSHLAKLFGLGGSQAHGGPQFLHTIDRGAGNQIDLCAGHQRFFAKDAETGEDIPVLGNQCGTVILNSLPSDGSAVIVDVFSPGAAITFVFDATPLPDTANTTYYIDTSIYTTTTTALYRLAERIRTEMTAHAWVSANDDGVLVLTVYDQNLPNASATETFLTKAGGDSATSIKLEYHSNKRHLYFRALATPQFPIKTSEDLSLNDGLAEQDPATLLGTNPWALWSSSGVNTNGGGAFASVNNQTFDGEAGPLGGGVTVGLLSFVSGNVNQWAMWYYRFMSGYNEPTYLNTFAPDKTFQVVSAYVREYALVDAIGSFGIGFYNATDSTWYRTDFTVVNQAITLATNVNGATGGYEEIGNGWYRVWCAYKTASAAEAAKSRRAGIYIASATFPLNKNLFVTGWKLEHVNNTILPSDYYVPVQEAYRFATVGDVTHAVNTTKTTRVDASKVAPSRGAQYSAVITLVAGTGGPGITTNAKISVTAFGSTKFFIFKPNGSTDVDADPNYYLIQDAGPTTAEAATLLGNKFKTLYPGTSVTISSNVVTIILPPGSLVAEVTDVDAQISIATATATYEAYIHVDKFNYDHAYWVRIKMGTYVATVAVASTPNGTTFGGAQKCVNGDATALATPQACAVTNGNKGVRVTNTLVGGNVLGAGTETVAEGLVRMMNLVFALTGDTILIDGYNLSGVVGAVSMATAKGLSVSRQGSTIRLLATSAFDKIETVDDSGNSALQSTILTADSAVELPPYAQDGFTVRVDGDTDSELDDYIAVADTDAENTFDKVDWNEGLDFGTHLRFDGGTMPHKFTLKRDDSSGSKTGTALKRYFHVEPIAWEEKLVGDDTLNPDPAFIGDKITDIDFREGRMFLTSGRRAHGSSVGLFYNFWRTTIRRVDDDDPLDPDASHSSVVTLKDMLAVGDKMILRSDIATFTLEGGDTLTPRNAHILQSENLPNLAKIPGVAASRSAFIPVQREDYGAIFELVPSDEGVIFRSQELTVPVPAYIDGEILQLTTSQQAGVLAILAKGNQRYIYIYRYVNYGNERIQSAWWRYDFGANAKVLSISFIQNTLHLLIRRYSDTNIETMTISPRRKDPGLAYLAHIDRRVSTQTSGVSASYGATSTFTLPYQLDPTATPTVVKQGNAEKLTITTTGTATVSGLTVSTITVSGNQSTEAVWIGQLFSATYRLSKHQLRSESGQWVAGRFQLRNGYLAFDRTRSFKVTVKDKAGNTIGQTRTYTAPDVIASTSTAASSTTPALDRGVLEFPISARSDEVTIILENNEHYPCALQKMEVTGEYVSVGDGKKVG